jgi:hypothetical protein
MHGLRLPARVVLFGLLVAATIARAQTPIVGAPVYLFQPGPISSTLLAAPASPDYQWGIAAWYLDRGTSATALSQQGNSVPSVFTSAANIPDQGGLPLVFALAYVMLSDLPPPSNTQPTTDIPVHFVTTGFVPGNNVPPGGVPTAAVMFAENNHALIGFAPTGSSVSSFSDYPIRIDVSNVRSLFGGGSIGGGGGC